MRDKIIETFVKVDDFCKEFSNEFSKYKQDQIESGAKTRNRTSSLSESEIITLLITFHSGQFRNFKSFYLYYVCVHLKSDFPKLVSYNRFIELSHRCALPSCFLYTIVLWGNVQELVLLILQYYEFVTIKELSETRYLKVLQRLGNLPWAGFSDLSCT